MAADVANDPNITESIFTLAMCHEIYHKRTQEAKLLVRLGGAINHKCGISGYTLLIYAASVSDLDAMIFAINAGADVNIPENDGWTPIVFAAAHLHKEGLELLMLKGANPFHTTNTGVDAVKFIEHMSSEKENAVVRNRLLLILHSDQNSVSVSFDKALLDAPVNYIQYDDRLHNTVSDYHVVAGDLNCNHDKKNSIKCQHDALKGRASTTMLATKNKPNDNSIRVANAYADVNNRYNYSSFFQDILQYLNIF